MIRIPALQTALMGLVGLRPHYTPNVPQYAPDLLECRSKVYLNDVHPLISPENLIAAMPKSKPTDFPVLNYTLPNAIGSVIYWPLPINKGQLFIAGADMPAGVAPDTPGNKWLPTDIVSAKLRQMLDAAAAQLANAIIQLKILDGGKSVVGETVTQGYRQNFSQSYNPSGATLYGQTQLYYGAGSIVNRIIKHSRFCGFEINVLPGRDLVVKLNRIGLQSDTPNPNLKIYLYHSSQSEPIQVFTPKFASSGTFSWAALQDAYFALNGSAYGPGGSFVLGYYEDDLQGQIIGLEKDWLNASVVRCGSCNPYDSAAFDAWSEYIEFHPFSIAEENLNDDFTLFDMNKVEYNYQTNFGLNLDVALQCDLTQFIANNESIVADALSKQAAINILQLFANSTQNDGLAERCRQAALYQLDNRENYSPGLVKELKNAYAAIAFDVSEANSPCAPQTPTDTMRVSNATV
jgi:hypothetical protein